MVQYVSPARRAADVLIIFLQDLLHVGGVEISGHNERRIWPWNLGLINHPKQLIECSVVVGEQQMWIPSAGEKPGMWSWDALDEQNSPKK